MATIVDQVAAIDAFLRAPKRVIGADQPPEWQPSLIDRELQLKLPLEVNGELPGATLLIIGNPDKPPLWFRLGILFPGMICRIDHTDEAHANPLGLVGVPAVLKGPHYHSWPLNRSAFKSFVRPAKLTVAVPYTPTAQTFDGNLRWFCSETNIESLPANHQIELPRPDRFL